MIGHGSGVTAHHLLASPGLESLVTIEIEPRIVDASRAFYPANARVFEDPRSTIVFDDAKAYFSHRRERYDLILSEPSNPWVSGTSSLFTREFYQRVGHYLTPEGVFAQWIQLYELTDDAAGTVLAAIHESFRDYAAFLVGDSDLLIVATNAPSLSAPDWTVATFPDLVHDLRHVHPLVPVHLEATRVFERASVAPFLDPLRPANSDYFPHLDLAAEKGRFLNSFASGLFGLASDRFDLAAALSSRRVGFSDYAPVPVWGIPEIRALGLSGWLRDPALRSRPASDVPAFEYRAAAQRHGELLRLLEGNQPPPRGWIQWTQAFRAVEAGLHGATAGVADEQFFAQVRQYLELQSAPAEVWASVDFLHGLAGWDAQEASDAAERLVEPVAEGEAIWIPASTLMDGTAWARITLGDPAGAQRALDRLLPVSGRGVQDFRVRLLQAHIRSLGGGQG